MDYSVQQEQCYEDKVFNSFTITIDGVTKEFTFPEQVALLELDDGTVLDVNIIGDELFVDINSKWLKESGREYEYIPGDRQRSYDEPILTKYLKNKGVKFCRQRQKYK